MKKTWYKEKKNRDNEQGNKKNADNERRQRQIVP